MHVMYICIYPHAYIVHCKHISCIYKNVNFTKINNYLKQENCSVFNINCSKFTVFLILKGLTLYKNVF